MMKKKKNTNKNLIEEIFPVVKEAVNRWQKGKIKLDSKDYYERKQHLEWVGDFIRLVWAEYKGSEIIISAARELEHGRYDHATVTARLNKGEVVYGYEKEFRGMGNGFYVALNNTGQIIKSEWD